jgi:hypothetical protein
VIRSFQNADLPILHQLWLEHWSTIGPPPVVRVAQIEQAVLARTFFRADALLIAQRESVAVAWLQLCRAPDDPDLIVIPTICLAANADVSLGIELLQEARRRAEEAGARRIEVGVVRDNRFGYAGLDPMGHGTGLSTADPRLQVILESSGFRIASRAVAMTVSVAGFRPPVSREGLTYRRTTRLEMEPLSYRDPRHAAGMSHLDVETQQLVDRSGQRLASLRFWFSDPEAEVMNPSLMIVDLCDGVERGRLDAAESYLLAASIQAVAQRNISAVETAVDEDQSELLSQLELLQFCPTAQGIRWTTGPVAQLNSAN